jgi:Leucine-rich repeat (LRR) protein
LTNLTRLQQLNLESNLLTGDIPSWVSDLTRLVHLRLGDNQLFGPIPHTLGNLTRLQNFSVGFNRGLTGEVPVWLCRLRDLEALLLEFTGMNGQIPRCIGNLTNLRHLDMRALPLTGTLSPELFELPSIEYILLSGASFTGGIPATLSSSAVTTTTFAPVATTTTTRTTVTTITATQQFRLPPPTGPRPLRLLILTSCGLSGEIPQWLADMPNLTAVELSGNDLTGPIPTFPMGAPIVQFSAANNRLTGTLEPLRNALGLTRLDVDSNKIDGTVDQWLADRSHNMTLLSTTNNYLSCTLPESTGISDNNAMTNDGKLSLLAGNLFGCPIPSGVSKADDGADSYSCGSDDLTFAGLCLGAMLAAVVVFVGRTNYFRPNAARVGDGASLPHSARPEMSTNHFADLFDTRSLTLEPFVTWIVLALTVVLVVILLPVYAAAPAVVECRFGWWTTAAFLAAAAGNDAGWGYGVAVVGGVVIGGAGSCALVYVGASRGVVTLGSSINAGHLRAWRVAAMLVLCVTVLVILVGINASFVLLEESPHASGATKDAVVVVFALLHELVDHVLSPLIVSVVVVVATGTSTSAGVSPSTVFVTSVAVEVVNSVLAPMIAQLGVSEGCFRDELFSSPEPVETSIAVGQCTCLEANTISEAECLSQLSTEGCSWVTYPVGVTYTPPFRFDGGRCISSIITLYSPEYIIIFALRILVYPVGWWLAHRGTPWIVTGIQPPVLLSSTFVRARRHMVRVVTCCFVEQSAGDDTVSDTDSYADVATASTSSFPVPAQSSSRAPSSPSSFALRSRADAVLETLHAIEPATHRFNLLVIVAGPGMFSPLVAVAGVASLVCLFLWQLALDRQFGTKGRHDETHDEHDQASVHAVHPMPLACVAILLLINTIYLVVLLSTSQLAWAGWTASVISWFMFVVSCWWCWDSLCGTVTQRTSTSRGRGHVEAPIELSEMLLPQQHEDEDADE